ncbi:MAG: ParB N-terminal domain-containing protein [Acidaminococcales bacterium]|jgi:hypothetical protein|nr:ParB N-terminal domain-containing protein [Acidaminococcales bacterium]
MIIAKRYEMVPLDDIVAYARNARKHSKEQIMQIRASFREFGVLSPCLVDEKYNLIAGHGRLEAARAEGLTEINCVVVEGLTDAQRKAFIIADNRLALNAGWDEELLALEFGELKDLGFDLELTGFDVASKEKAATLMGRDYKDMQAAITPQYAVRRLTPTECALLQGFPPDWCAYLETPAPDEEEISFWMEVFETYRLAAGKSSKPKSRRQIVKWLRNPHSDSAEYKMWGNGVALPCVCFVLGGIVRNAEQ